MKIMVCYPKVPYIKGGSEILIKWLVDELKKRNYLVEEISIPLIWKTEKDILDNYNIWKTLDLASSEIPPDLVISTKFPSFTLRHPNKIIWLFHQFRQIYDWAGTELGWKCNTPVQVEIRDKLIKMDNIAFSEAKKLFAISQNVADRLKRYNGFNAEVLYPIPPNRDQFRCDKYDNFFLHVGRLEKNKRIELILEAFKKYNENYKLIFAGEGSQKKYLEKKTEDLGLTDKVKFLGWISKDELLRLYSETLAVVFTAFDEDFGLVVAEAFLSKKAVIATSDSGGATELVKNDQTGLICQPEPDSIAECFLKATQNRKKIIEMGKKAYELIKKWNFDFIIKQLISIS